MPRNILIDRLQNRAQNHGQDQAYFTKIGTKWVPINWSEYHQRVRSFAKALMANKIGLGAKIAILGSNRLEWMLSCMGAQYAGCVSVGIYPSSSPEEVAYVVSHSDAEILVVENIKRYQTQIKPHPEQFNKIKLIILMSNEEPCEGRMLKFADFLTLGVSQSDNDLDARVPMIRASDIATMIYTSGTTGNPKSVMLSHESIAWTVRTVVQSWHCGPSDRALSYLPLAHVAEQMFSVYAPIECGLQQYFATSLEEFRNNLKEVEPTVFFGVPRVYEKIYEAVKSAINEQTNIKKQIINYFSDITNNYYNAHHKSQINNLWTSLNYMFARFKIFKSIKNKIGLGKTRLCLVGAAPISKDILRFFTGIDIPIYEVYGQSENSGPATICLPGKAVIGSAGRALLGSEIKLASDGEILIRGPHVFSGYYKDEAATNETLKNSWLYTGDIGQIDQDGFLYITDRKKDILITAGGKNISPQNLEAMLKQLPYVQSAVVVGDSKKYLAALLSPDPERMLKKAGQMGVSPEKALTLVDNQEIHKEIQAELEKLNQRLAPVEQIKKYTLLPHEFSIDSGEFTPTLKVKRKYVNQKYQKEIAGMY